MSNNTRLESLLLVWQEQQAQGRDMTEELCSKHPELATELAEQIRMLRHMNALLAPAAGTAVYGAPAAPGSQGTEFGETAHPNGAKFVSAKTPSGLPGYEILGELGRGGMGVVYKARQIRLRRTVALKMIRSGGHASQSEFQRFRTEAEAIARLQHPHIVQIYEVGEHDGLPYFSLEFCAGGSLDKKLASTPQPPEVAAAVVEKIARAVQVAHDNGVIHRDLKPANILLARNPKSETRNSVQTQATKQGDSAAEKNSSDSGLILEVDAQISDCSPKITDFGLAKQLDEAGQTQSGAVMGTPSYMAPEQASGRSNHLGPPCDIYALGAILYEMLTGRPPFRAATAVDTLMQVTRDEPIAPSRLQPKVPKDLETICLKCLRKEPHKRYGSALELADDLERFRTGNPVLARPTGTLERGWRWSRRNPVVAASLLGVALALLTGTVVSSLFAVWANDARVAEANLAHREGIAKNEAEARARSEKAAKQEAEQARGDAQRQLVELSAGSGLAAARDGDHSLALLWFARAVQLAKDFPDQEQLNRIRIANWLRQVCLPEGTFSVPGFRQNIDHFRQFQFSPDGNYLVVVASTGDCLVWDRQRGQLVPLPEAAAKGTAAAWQPLSNLLTVAEKSGAIRFLAAPDFRPVDQVSASGEITVLAFSRDGKRLAWGGSDGARVWDRDRKEFVTPLLSHSGKVTALSFSSTGELLATADDSDKARVFRVPSDEAEPLFPPVTHIGKDGDHSHRGPDVACPRFAAADQILLTVDPNKDRDASAFLKWRSSTTGKPVYTNTESGIVAVSEQGNHVASLGSVKGRLFDAFKNKEVSSPIPAPAYWMWNEHAIFSADERMLVTCGHDTRARFFSVEDRSGELLTELYSSVYLPMLAVRVGLTTNGRHLATAVWDGTVHLWRMPSGPPIAYQAHAGGMTTPALSPDKKFVVPRGVSYKNGSQLETRVYDASTGEPAGPTLEPGGILIDAAFSPDATLVATASSTGRTPFERNKLRFQAEGAGGHIQIWDWKTGQRLVGPIATPGEPRGLAFRPDGSLLAAVCTDYRVLLIDPKMAAIKHLDPGLRTRPTEFNQWFSNGEARFSPDGRFLVTWETTNHVHVWDPDRGQLLHTLNHNERVKFVAFAPNASEIMATAGWSGDARVWNLSSGKLVMPLKHPRWLYQLQFSPDGKELITSGDDGLLRAWNWQAGKVLDGWPLHPAPIRDFRFTADRRSLVSIGEHDLQVTDWPTKAPASPRWKTAHPNLLLDIPVGDDRVIVGGFSHALVGYDLKAMLTPAPDSTEDLVALVELAAGRRILREGNVVPLNNTEWAERWNHVNHKKIASLEQSADVERQESQGWFNVGLSLHAYDLSAAIDAYTKSLRLDGQDVQAWRQLGNAQLIHGNTPASIEAFKKVVALDSNDAHTLFELGNTLRLQEDHPAASSAYKKAIAINPSFAEAYCNMRLSLLAEGDIAQALEALQKGHDIGSRRAGWQYPSARWLQYCQQLIAMEKRIPSVLQGQPAKTTEYLALAELSRLYKKRYGDAVRLYTKALVDDSKLPQQTIHAMRYQAACAAILAAAGKGAYADKLPDEEKSALRRQALDWLTTDLSARRNLLQKDPLAAAIIKPDIESWHKDGNLASVRDAKELATLPDAEQKAWHEFWTDVQSLSKETRGSHAETKRQGTLTTGRRERVHLLPMSAGQTYAIDMESTAFDTYLRLEDSEGKVLDENDDISPNINLNSRIIFNPKNDGIYRIVATSFQARGIGPYSLTIRAFPSQEK